MLAVYVRISVDRSNEVSTEVQREHGEQFAEKLGLKAKVYEDIGVSGGAEIEDRPEFQRMIQDLDKRDSELTAVWAYDDSRLYRSSRTKETFLFLIASRSAKHKKAGKEEIKIYFNGKEFDWSSPQEKMIHSIVTSVNEFYIDQTSEKIAHSLRKIVGQGKTRGVMPYGYTKDEAGYMVIDPEESEVVKRIYKLSLEGKGFRKIAEILNDEEIPTRYQKIAEKSGKTAYRAFDNVRKTYKYKNISELKWREKTVLDIVKNPLYKGERKFSGETYEAPAIFESNYWQKVNDNIKNNRNTTHGNAKRYNHLMRGMLVCGRCGRNYHGRVNKSDNFYMCTSKRYPKENCGNRSINRPFIEEFVWLKFFRSGEFEKHIEDYFEDISDKSNLTVLKKKIKKLNKDLGQIDKDRQELRKFLVQGVFTKSEYEQDKADLDKKQKEVKERLSKAEEELKSVVSIDKDRRQIKRDLKSMAKKLTFEEKQTFVAKYLDYIEVDFLNDVYFLKLHFKQSNMRPELYYIEKDYSIGFNITQQPLERPEGVNDFPSETMIINRLASSILKLLKEGKKSKADLISFDYYSLARKHYMEAKSE
ncbi:recombinase family protein [Robiginitalea aurantiaca]|uniref:Recombinase family protein n=1 Tax=Robiginitalea aurantiaca TaxID=3056915 RepID=A0ABT7WGT0_9FLAO|nr:recombinase family protein [Robiginitalea aurantiaca]MDM9632129.1 recombinase family protein [Robiginitalea aurantiaca]